MTSPYKHPGPSIAPARPSIEFELDALRVRVAALERGIAHVPTPSSIPAARPAPAFAALRRRPALVAGTLLVLGVTLLYGQQAVSALFVDAQGQVGIGTTTPGSLLDVRGTAHADRAEIGSGTFDQITVKGRVQDQAGPVIAPPVGAIIAYAGDTAPDGWLLCDSREIPAGEAYAKLRAMMSNGRVPDLQRRMLLGAATDATVAADQRLGQQGGKATHTLTINEMPKHRHYYYGENLPNFEWGDFPGGGNKEGSGAYDKDIYLSGHQRSRRRPTLQHPSALPNREFNYPILSMPKSPAGTYAEIQGSPFCPRSGERNRAALQPCHSTLSHSLT